MYSSGRTICMLTSEDVRDEYLVSVCVYIVGEQKCLVNVHVRSYLQYYAFYDVV